MNLPTLLLTLHWMIRDTLRQSLASRLFWAMLAVSGLCIAFCFSVRVKDAPRLPVGPSDIEFKLPKGDPELKGKDATKEGVDLLGQDELALGFGAFKITTNRGHDDSVRFLQVWLASLVAGTAGIFLAVIWTAGFLPSFLDPNHATVLLAKPVPRWHMLLGKVLGVLAFALLQATFFVVGTWFALGVATGVFDMRYLFAIPVLLIHFGVFYSMSAMLAVWTRSTVVCIFGTLLFWVICWGMNFGRHAIVSHEPKGLSAGAHAIVEIGYWVLPKPVDLNAVFDDALETQGFAASVPELQSARDKGRVNLFLSVLASMGFGLAMFGVAAHEFRNAEY